jgi:cytochrome c biogenesis protein CcdA
MKNWKNAIKKAALAVIIAVSFASVAITTAGAFNYASASEQNLYWFTGVINLVFGAAAIYALIQKAQKMDVINNAKEIK